MIADAKQLVGDYLRTHPDIVGLDARVSVKMPSNPDQAWVKLSELASNDHSADTDHLVSHLLQMDCYAAKGDGAIEANLLGRTVRAALRDLEPADVPGWTPSVVMVNGPRDLGVATEFEPAKDRTMVEAEILFHPVGGS